MYGLLRGSIPFQVPGVGAVIADLGTLNLDVVAHNWLPIAIGLLAAGVILFFVARHLGERQEEQRGREWGPR